MKFRADIAFPSFEWECGSAGSKILLVQKDGVGFLVV